MCVKKTVKEVEERCDEDKHMMKSRRKVMKTNRGGEEERGDDKHRCDEEEERGDKDTGIEEMYVCMCVS